MSYRADHWVIAAALTAGGNPVRACAVTACGIPLGGGHPNERLADGFYVPSSDVECAACRASELYHETLTTIEIGFDGSREAWWQAHKATLPRLE